MFLPEGYNSIYLLSLGTAVFHYSLILGTEILQDTPENLVSPYPPLYSITPIPPHYLGQAVV